MLTKKQINLIAGFVISIIFAFAIFATSDGSKLSLPFEKNSESENVEEISVVSKDDLDVLDAEEIVVGEEAISLPPSETPTQIQEVLLKVTKVVDGDTIDVEINGEVKRLRLIGINTPETVDPRTKVECFGREASSKAKELLEGGFVSLESDESQGERDKYGRLLRYVFLPDGTNYNQFMISQGYAYEYTYDLPYKYQFDFKQAEVNARNQNLGLWSPQTCSGNK